MGTHPLCQKISLCKPCRAYYVLFFGSFFISFVENKTQLYYEAIFEVVCQKKRGLNKTFQMYLRYLFDLPYDLVSTEATTTQPLTTLLNRNVSAIPFLMCFMFWLVRRQPRHNL